MLRELRRDLTLNGLQRIVGMGAREVPENGRDAVQRPAGILQSGDGVLESWCRGVACDAVDLSAMFGEGLLEGRLEVLRLDFGKGRHAEGRGPGGEQRICGRTGAHGVETSGEAREDGETLNGYSLEGSAT